MGLKTVVLNSERMNYDGKLDLSVLSSEVKEYASTEQDQILERVQGMDVVVTKEMPVDGDTIARFPDSVQLICEAGTGYTCFRSCLPGRDQADLCFDKAEVCNSGSW